MRTFKSVIKVTAVLSILINTNTSSAIAETSDTIASSAYTHQQHLVDIDNGRHLNLFCVGEGDPTVVFEAGLGWNIMTWRHVQGTIAKVTKACSYDRAGYGFSETSERSSDAHNTVDDLHQLIIKASIKRPIILVGHSIGGLYYMLYAWTYPKDVAGMVLVDPSVIGEERLLRSNMTDEQKTNEQSWIQQNFRDVKGCLALAKEAELAKPDQQQSLCLDNPPYSPDSTLHLELNREWAKSSTYAANLSEWESVTAAEPDGTSIDDAEMPTTKLDFGDLPLTILTSGQVVPFYGQTLEQARESKAIRLTSHQALASTSKYGSSIDVPDSGHYIQDDQPAVVSAAIKSLIDRARDIIRNDDTDLSR